MAINLKNPEVEALLKAMVAETGESLTEAARAAFSDRLAALKARKKPGRERFLPEILEMIEKGRSLPTLDARPSKEVLDELWGEP
jgi:antitoxin VapB